MIYIFQQIPAGFHAPKFRILKKKKVVHPPSRLTIYLNMILTLLDLILLGLIYQIHNLSVPLVAVLINGVKKQVPQVSFETAAADLI